MTYKGIARGKKIDLDEFVSFPDGTRVTVDISAESPVKGSPAAILNLVGTLEGTEAESILNAAQRCRRVDEKLWADNA